MIGIQVVSWAGATPSTPATAWFGAAGGDIGRSAECTLSLPDPERHISRRHAVVALRQGRYVLQSLSANVALVIDDITLAPGDEAQLTAGMRITIGAYTLQVLDEPEPLSLPRTSLAALPAAKPSAPAPVAAPKSPAAAAPAAVTPLAPPAPAGATPSDRTGRGRLRGRRHR
jgi:predicted component of type VI protein secretion system